LGGERLLQTLAARKAFSEQTCPFRRHFLVNAVEQEDEEPLKGSGDGEEDQEDGDDDIFRDKEHEVSEDPRESDRDVDRNVDSKLLLSVSLIGFGSTSQRFMDFSSDEEEEDSVRGNDEESRDEEGQETSQVVGDPALSSISVCDCSVLNS